MPNPKIVTIGSLTLALLLGVGAMVVHARVKEDPQANDGIGVVDMDRVFSASDAPNQLAKQSAQIEAEAQKRIDSFLAVPQLNPKELDEYGGLIAIAQPTPDQQNRIKDLKALSDKRSDDFHALQMKANLTAEEGVRLKELQVQSRLLERIMPGLQSDLRAQAMDREETVKRGLIAQLRGEVSKVAQEKKILHVFDSNALIYSANDITQIVVQRVSKHK